MTRTTTRPQWVARAVTLSLWAVGSAYLVKNEIASGNPDPVVLAATPVVWAVVITLPILATYARYDRQWTAMALIWLAAIVGSAYTLQATVGRQAAVRDVAVASAADIVRQRDSVEKDLTSAKASLDAARQRCGTGKVCLDSTKLLIQMYERQVSAHEAKLETLALPAPRAGEQRIAWLLTLATGKDATEVVGMLLPALFGIVIELAAFSCAMYGWHPSRERLPTVSAQENNRKMLTYTPPRHPVIVALENIGKPVSNGELARLMGVTAGEASKRRQEVANLLKVWREGQHVMAALA